MKHQSSIKSYLATLLLITLCPLLAHAQNKPMKGFVEPKNRGKEVRPALDLTKQKLTAARAQNLANLSPEERDEKIAAEIMKLIAGGMNSGGGNSLNNRPIEAFRKNFKEIRGFKEFVLPLLGKINEKIPGSFVDNLMYEAERQIWFYVPVILDLIPRELSGIPIHTSQSAINTKKIVWVSSTSHDVKKTEDAGILILHEIVMGYVRSNLTWYSKTHEIISETQRLTSILLDVDRYSDVELVEKLNLFSAKLVPASVATRNVKIFELRKKVTLTYETPFKQACTNISIKDKIDKILGNKFSNAEIIEFMNEL